MVNELPKALKDWPETIKRPRFLTRGGLGGCCVSMYLVKVMGGTKDEVYGALCSPIWNLKKLGVPDDVALRAARMNDNPRGFGETKPIAAFDYLLEACGYDIVEVEG